GLRFFERSHVKDVLAYLRLLVNPDDNESFFRAVNYPARGIGATSLERLQAYADECQLTMYKAAKLLDKVEGLQDRAKRSIGQFRAFIDKYVSLKSQMSLSELTRSMVDELGILKNFKEEGTAESMGRWENVQELLSAISEFSEEHPDGTLEAFLEEVTLVSDIDTWDETRNVVTLMTLHSSKGLEFPVVFIAGVEEGLLPFYSMALEKNELEEERRLFYVGITRSQSKLYISKAHMRYRYGEPTFCSPSRFLSELGEDSLQVLESKSNRRAFTTESSERGWNGRRRSSSARRTIREEESYAHESPNYEDESQEVFELKQGVMVRHEMFGKGKVIRVSGKGDSMKAVVQFEEHGVKNLIVKFARLRSA
ncbi:MAG: 3'-5' exonuclease, partial [Bacteroidota bacterium]